jgi:branched-chain amino acid transport system ATP-binding protein
MLEVKNLHVSYGAIKALHGVSLSVKAGSIVTLIGSNGAGKSTTLRAISGLVKPRAGEILYEGQNIAGLPAHQIVARELLHVPEGRMVFANLTVQENLMMGAYLQHDKNIIAAELELVFKTFPRLKEREKQAAGTLSGGEQQMLAIGRALMSKPKFLMMDEPSLGIAPLLVKTIFEKIVEINRTHGITSCSLNKTPTWHWRFPTMVTCWRRGRLFCRTNPPYYVRTRKCAARIWAGKCLIWDAWAILRAS